jgi:hypothetical protein
MSTIHKTTSALRRLSTLGTVLILAVGLTACAGLQRSTASLPTPAVLGALPVIKLGQAKPASGDYIVYLPASEVITTQVKVQGSLFDQTDSKELHVRLKRDVYLYKNWVSFDKLDWKKDDQAVTGNISVRLPGYDEPRPGEVLIDFNLKG